MLTVFRSSVRSLRSSQRQACRAAVRLNSTAAPAAATTTPAAATTAAAEAEAKAPVDPKISVIVEQISKLTLLETSSLISELKTQLNIPDISFPAAGSAPSATAAPAEEEAAAAKEEPEEKTIFAVKLESFDAKSKAKIIKEVKGLLGLSLVDSKKFVESAPKVLKDNVAKEDADKIKETLEKLGAKVSLE